MRGRRINTLLWIGLTGTIIFGTSFVTDLYRAFGGDHRDWWTHQDMRLTVEQTKDNFELYLAGKPLQKHLSDRTLFGTDKDEKQYPIVAKDVTVRLNHWDKTRASILTQTTMSGFGLGVTITLLVIGLIQVFHREEKPR